MNNFNTIFPVGKIRNEPERKFQVRYPAYKKIVIVFPSRLNAMAIDPSQIKPNAESRYSAGEVCVCINLYKKISVKVIENGELIISDRTQRKSIVRHCYLLMKYAIGFECGLEIDIDNSKEIPHVGLGSSSSLIAGLAAAINELFGNILSKDVLIRFITKNHGEEVNGDPDNLCPVQCIGGSANAGFYDGGIIVITGEATIIGSAKIDPLYKVVVGIPKNFKPIDGKIALEEELKNMQGFIECGKKFGDTIAYNILHRGLPEMQRGNIKEIGDIIYEYRFNMGSIKNCSFLFPEIIGITDNLRFLKEKNIVEILSISSVGPSVFAVTKNIQECMDAFSKNALIPSLYSIENSQYQIIKKERQDNVFWNNVEIVNFFSTKTACPIIKNELKNLSGKRDIIDIGCGGGRHTEIIDKFGHEVYALDKSPAMLECTIGRLQQIPGRDLRKRVKLGDILKIPFPNDSFDIAIAYGVIHQATSKDEYSQIFKELNRIMRIKGEIFVNVFTGDHFADDYSLIEKDVVITNEGLYMTLPTTKDFLGIAKNHGFYINKKDIVKETKNVGTGVRSILKCKLIKVG